MATKKASKVTKTVKKDDGVYWVVLERRPFSSKAVGLYKTRTTADEDARYLDAKDSTVFNRFVVQRVELQG